MDEKLGEEITRERTPWLLSVAIVANYVGETLGVLTRRSQQWKGLALAAQELTRPIPAEREHRSATNALPDLDPPAGTMFNDWFDAAARAPGFDDALAAWMLANRQRAVAIFRRVGREITGGFTVFDVDNPAIVEITEAARDARALRTAIVDQISARYEADQANSAASKATMERPAADRPPRVDDVTVSNLPTSFTDCLYAFDSPVLIGPGETMTIRSGPFNISLDADDPPPGYAEAMKPPTAEPDDEKAAMYRFFGGR